MEVILENNLNARNMNYKFKTHFKMQKKVLLEKNSSIFHSVKKPVLKMEEVECLILNMLLWLLLLLSCCCSCWAVTASLGWLEATMRRRQESKQDLSLKIPFSNPCFFQIQKYLKINEKYKFGRFFIIRVMQLIFPSLLP